MGLNRFLKAITFSSLWTRTISTRPQTNVARDRLRRLSSRSMLVLMLATVTLTGAIGYRYYNEPQLTVGTLAPQTIHATQTVLVEDEIATELARKDARQSTALNVFTLNAALTQNIETDFADLLVQVESLRRLAGPLPFLPTQTVSVEGQSYLRQMEQTQLKDFLRSIETGDRSIRAIDTHLANPTGQRVYTELNHLYRRPSVTQEWTVLRQALTRANEQYHFARRSIADPLTRIQTEDLLNISNQTWSALPKKLQIVLRRMLAQGVAPGLSPNITRHAVATHVSDWSAPERQAAIQLLPLVMRPNLVVDPAETIRQQEQAARSIEPILVQVRAGEVIVQENQPITSASFALLDHLGLSRRMPNWGGLFTTLSGVLVAIGVLVWVRQRHYQQRFHQRWSHRDDLLVLILALTIPITTSLTDALYPPLPAVGILMGSFYGSVMGAVVTVLMSIVTPLGLSLEGRAFTVIALGSLVGSIMAGQARSREELARVGLVVGMIQAILYALLLGSTSNIDVFSLGGAALRQGFIGVGWSVVALGMSPYLEKLFDLITPIRLAELANPNRPLLKQLAELAPGTFQHTQFVTTLAEAGARALNCNVELVRTGTLYHDIGKMHDPQAFIENQFGGPNKHVLLNDPWQSAHLIRLHVTEGLVMARRAGLPSAVQAFIPEHQGTMMISYFYQQAWELARQSPKPLAVREQDFRYDGPRPQSRETGIVMLADSCEAALRAMKHTNPEDALRTVNQIFKARWKEQQLVDAQLSREDLDCLARTFVQVWQQANHERIPYPQPIVSSLRAPTCAHQQLKSLPNGPRQNVQEQ